MDAPETQPSAEQSASFATEEQPSSQAPLSKNARKRLLKLEQKESRKEKRKEEKRIRKQQRMERAAAGEVLPPPSPQSTDDTTATDGRDGVLPDLDAHREAAWATWRRLGSPQFVLAPMVNQSELAFRLLARQHGAGLCYTPMLHSTRFAAEEAYRTENFDDHPSDRPLIAQFCGDDPATLLSAARHVQDRCDLVDLNCGCPQGIARRGHYGAFLLDEPELIEGIVRTLSRGLRVPVSVKIRVLPSDSGGVDVEATVALARRLEMAGASLLTVHGRTRAQKCACECDWGTIRKVKQSVSIPVIANGGVERPEDLQACLAATACDAVMSSEAMLENPLLFSGVPTSRAAQATATRQYMELARAHPPRAMAVLKAHFFKLLYMALEAHRDLRERLGAAIDHETMYAVVTDACEREEAASAEAADTMSARCDCEGSPFTSWYRRHRGPTAAPADRYGSCAAALPNAEQDG